MPRPLILLVPVAAVIAAVAFYLQTPPPPPILPAPSSLTSPEHSPSVTASGSNRSKTDKPGEGDSAQIPVPGELREIMQLVAGIDRRQRVERFGFEAAQKDPELALKQLSLLRGADRAAYLRGVFEHFSTLPAAEALAWAKKIERGADRDLALTAMMNTWRAGDAQDPAAEARAMERFGVAGGLGFRLLGGDHPDPALAAMWAKEMTNGRAQAELLGNAAAVLARTDPAAALALGNELTGEERAQFLRRAASGWAEGDFDAAWAYAKNLTDDRERNEVQAGMLRDLSRNDASAAAARLSELPAGDERNRTLGMVMGSWSMRDPQAALAWAQSQSDPELQTAAFNSIERAASFGLGFNAQRDNEGYLVVGDTRGPTPNGLRQNDRIVSVTDSKGQAVDTRGMSATQLLEKVRANGETPVTLQVMSPDNAPRTVQLAPRRFPTGGGNDFGRGFGGNRGPGR